MNIILMIRVGRGQRLNVGPFRQPVYYYTHLHLQHKRQPQQLQTGAAGAKPLQQHINSFIMLHSSIQLARCLKVNSEYPITSTATIIITTTSGFGLKR